MTGLSGMCDVAISIVVPAAAQDNVAEDNTRTDSV
jgi:hypothetical protein